MNAGSGRGSGSGSRNEDAIATPDLRDLRNLRRIAVLRALQLGDLLCVVPALRALRAAAPQAEITLIGLPWARTFVQRFRRYLDDFIAFPGFPGLPEGEPQIGSIPGFIAIAQQRRFDLAIQLHGSGVLLNPLTVALGATHTAGFHSVGQYCPDPLRFLPWIEQEHEVQRYLRLMTFLGARAQGEHLEFPLLNADHAALQTVAGLAAPGSYACIHPGARLPSRRWAPRRFAEVADRLAERGLQIVLTGAAEEAGIIQAVQRMMQAPALDLTGKTSLGAMAALVAEARLVVCNDTGISHIAAAVATPSVVICSGADPARWAPLDRQRHRLLHQPISCRPCTHFSCPLPGHPCADGISVAMVLPQLDALLGAQTHEQMHERMHIPLRPARAPAGADRVQPESGA